MRRDQYMQTVDDRFESPSSKHNCDLSNLRFHELADNLVVLTVVRSIGEGLLTIT